MRTWQQMSGTWLQAQKLPSLGFRQWALDQLGIIYYQQDWDNKVGAVMEVTFNSEQSALMFRLQY